MEIDEVNVVLLDLKYCERCGGLWLRPQDCDDVLCASCAAQVTKLQSGWRARNIQLALKTTIESGGETREVLVMCGDGGNA
jgi:Zn-finger nucleic acid-binding protein